MQLANSFRYNSKFMVNVFTFLKLIVHEVSEFEYCLYGTIETTMQK